MQRLEVSGAVRPLYGSLGVKGLTMFWIVLGHRRNASQDGFWQHRFSLTELVSSSKSLHPSGYNMYHKVEHYKNYMFCPHSAFMLFVLISEETGFFFFIHLQLIGFYNQIRSLVFIGPCIIVIVEE